MTLGKASLAISPPIARLGTHNTIQQNLKIPKIAVSNIKNPGPPRRIEQNLLPRVMA